MFDSFYTNILDWILKRPAILRAFLNFSARQGSVRKVGSLVTVLGHHEVLQVLAKKAEFTLAPTMQDRILSGDFLLNMDESTQYLNDKARMKSTFYGTRYDLIADIESFSKQRSLEILGQITNQTTCAQIDVVGALAEQVAADVIFQLVIGYNTTAPEDFIDSLRWLARLIIAGGYDKSELQPQFNAANANINSYLNKRLECGQSKWRAQSVVAQMLDQDCSSIDIKRFVGGIAAAGVATIARATGQAVNELLHRPQAMQITHAAAIQGDTALVLQCCMEALRFNPMLSFIPRHCERDTFIHCRDGKSVAVRKGTPVMLSLFYAMFDKHAFPDPERFLINRPLQSYLHFGEGMHRCFGEAMAHAQIAQIVMALLQHSANLQRSEVPGRGFLEYEGPALRHLWVTGS